MNKEKIQKLQKLINKMLEQYKDYPVVLVSIKNLDTTLFLYNELNMLNTFHVQKAIEDVKSSILNKDIIKL